MSAPEDSAVTYCDRWNSLTRGPIRPIGEDEARRRDASGAAYLALIDDAHDPEAIVEVRWENSYLGVWFLDEDGRRYLKYTFTKLDDSQMFLTSVMHWEYSAESDGGRGDINNASTIVTYEYQQNGVVRETRHDKQRGEEEIIDRSDVPLDINWEKVPRFGDWASVTRLDREPGPPG